ncbi:MAG: hypothetical protein LUE26_00755 [Alistipes sp.]|nr:hypothetical protein [Alistipes sp.]
MAQLTIEKADRKRYSLMVWQTTGFGIFLAAFIFAPEGTQKPGFDLVEFIRGLGVGLALAATFKMVWFEHRVKKDRAVANALRNELYRDYDRKALAWGFLLSMSAAFVLFVLSMEGLGIRLAAGIILYVGLVSSRVAQLIYYR